MAHPLFGPEVRMMLLDNNTVGLKAVLETLNPSTIAETLSEDAFTVEEVWQVLQAAESRRAAVVFEYFPIEWQVKLAEGAARPQMARLIELMSHDDRVALLRRLPSQVSEALLRLVDEADRRDIASLFRYAENSVGAIMTTDYAWLPINLTTGQAIERLRAQAPDRETIYYVYVLDEATRRMLGILSLRALVMSEPGTPIRDVMLKRDPITLRASDDREKAATALIKYDLLALPVLDDDGRLVGIVTHDDIVDVITQEATEDIQRAGGMEALDRPYLEVGFWEMMKKRGGWLSILFLGEMLTATAMTYFQGEIEKAVVLAMFVPLIISSGGNSGSQASTLVIRSLALIELRLRDWWRVLGRELKSGLALGTWLGLIGFLRVAIWHYTGLYDYGEHHFLVGLTVFLALIGVVTLGSVSGSMLPFILRRIGFDPATSSAPFVATLVDVSGLVIYFTVAVLILTGRVL